MMKFIFLIEKKCEMRSPCQVIVHIIDIIKISWNLCILWTSSIHLSVKNLEYYLYLAYNYFCITMCNYVLILTQKWDLWSSFITFLYMILSIVWQVQCTSLMGNWRPMCLSVHVYLLYWPVRKIMICK